MRRTDPTRAGLSVERSQNPPPWWRAVPKEGHIMHGEPVTESRPPIERKVTASTVGAYFGSVAGLAVLQALGADVSILGPLPDLLESLIVSLLPGGIAFIAGLKAKHTPRPDLPQSQR
ncbi:hypothetical protein ACLQ2R_03100 [Streptosporangium sp. DT93]|uniref:hypothetical protein n=1 Tax=Streptosporangium sp. DT93 TaxID=3393428 RepID=UPI003CE7FD04